MKKELLITATLLWAGTAGAQTQKGNGILGGGIVLGYGLQKNPFYKTTSFAPSLDLQVGHFVADNWVVGANLQFSGAYSRGRFMLSENNSSRSQRNAPEITPFVRRYWSVGPALLFAGAGINVAYRHSLLTSINNTGATSEARNTNLSVNPTVEVGGTYFLSKRLALQGTLSGVGLPVPATNIGLGLIYWIGPNGTGATNPESTFSTTQEGNWVVEGGFSANKSRDVIDEPTRYRETTTNELSINASVGRFIADKTLLGVGLGFSSQKPSNPTGNGPYQTYSISPYLQRYLSNRRLTPFVRATIVYSNSGGAASDQRLNSLQGGVGLGLAYLVSNRFMVETSLANASYQFIKFDKDNSFQTVNLSAQLGSGFSLRYVISGRK